MDLKFKSFYYSERDNRLVFLEGYCILDKTRVHYRIVNERDSDLCDDHCTIEYFKTNFKRVGWLEE